MTKTQIWVAAFLGIFIVLFGISKITEKKSPENNTSEGNMTEQTPQASTDQNPLTLIKTNGCIACHGSDLTGSPMAPSLMNVKKHWDSREELITYLRNPSTYSGSEYIEEYKKKYKSVVMPSYNHVDVKDLGKIADYLLGLGL